MMNRTSCIAALVLVGLATYAMHVYPNKKTAEPVPSAPAQNIQSLASMNYA